MKIVLSDGEVDCPQELLHKFKVLYMINEDFPCSTSIPLNSITKNSFIKILQFAETGIIPDAPLDMWCVTDEQYAYLKELCLDADYLNYQELYDAICKLISVSLTGKSKEDIERILT
jgi:hypothetical protein